MLKPTPQQLAPQSEAAAEDTGVFEEESAPSGPPSPSKALSEEQPEPVGTILVEEVIGALGRVHLFDARSLDALRRTCKGFRDLVDSTDALSSAKFVVWDHVGLDLLKTWASGSRLTPRTRSLSITGDVPAKLAGQVVAGLRNHRPPLSKLELVYAGAAADLLITAPLDSLRELRLQLVRRNSRSFIEMINNTSIKGLQSLSLERVDDIEASDLAAALALFRELQSLQLTAIQIQGRYVDPGVLKNALTRLETLEVTCCTGIEKLGLLCAALPALRTFKLSNETMSTAPLCLNHLTKLNINDVRLRSPGVVVALNGGPLQELRLNLGYQHDSFAYWNWNGLELPYLTRLELLHYPSLGDAMGDVARARLPALHSITLPFGLSTTISSVEAFAAAFPLLSELKIDGMHNSFPTAAAVEALGRKIVPRLEALQWSAHVGCNRVTTLLHSLLPAGPADSAPCWPRLHLLDLDLGQKYCTSELHNDAFQSVARAAPHTPSLVSLRIMFGDVTSREVVDAFVATAKEVKAWPQLHNICVSRSSQHRYNFPEKLQQVWPQATVLSSGRWQMKF